MDPYETITPGSLMTDVVRRLCRVGMYTETSQNVAQTFIMNERQVFDWISHKTNILKNHNYFTFNYRIHACKIENTEVFFNKNEIRHKTLHIKFMSIRV